jgi:hypothetical protein
VLADLVDKLTFIHGESNFLVGGKMPLNRRGASRSPRTTGTSFLHRTADFADLNGGFST